MRARGVAHCDLNKLCMHWALGADITAQHRATYAKSIEPKLVGPKPINIPLSDRKVAVLRVHTVMITLSQR